MSTKSLVINNTTQAGKKRQTSMSFVNPAVSNEDAGTFAQMAMALTTNRYVSAQVVKKMDVTEQEQGGGLLDPCLEIATGGANTVTWLGNGVCRTSDGTTINKGDRFVRDNNFLMLESDGTYAQAWL